MAKIRLLATRSKTLRLVIATPLQQKSTLTALILTVDTPFVCSNAVRLMSKTQIKVQNIEYFAEALFLKGWDLISLHE